MTMLPPRQQQALDILISYQREHGFPPTNAELASLMGARSTNTAVTHLRALQRKGLITIRPHQSRGIVINKSFCNPDSYVISLVRALVDGKEYAKEHAVAWLETHEEKPCA